MKVIKAKFWFRGFEFEFSLLGRKKPDFSDRVYNIWVVVVIRNKEPQSRHEIFAFVPSACICKIILKRYYKRPLSKKRIKQISKNLVHA